MTRVPVDDLRNRALRVAAASEVNDVRLFQVNASLNALPESGPLHYDMDSEVTFQYLPEQSVFIVNSQYTIVVGENVPDGDEKAPSTGTQQPEAEEPEALPNYSLSFLLAALFTVTSPEGGADFAEDELDAFARTTGQFALHPYAREFVAEMTGRSGLPTLHVGMLKLHLDAPNDE